jgi:hypothetical protein
MNMDRTVCALTDLSAVDDQLSRKGALMDRGVLALEARRAALREAIPRIFLAAYDALGRMGCRPVVVEVRGAHCSGCYLRLPPQLSSSIRRRQSLCPCPHCCRLLYMPSLRQESETSDASKHSLGGGLAAAGRASKRVRRITPRRPLRQESDIDKGRPELKGSHA